MDKHTPTDKSPAIPPFATEAKEAKDKTLADEAETAAAKDEPMGSIAAAVPGDDDAAENGLEPGRKPGAEETTVKKEPGSTAGTEFPAAKKGPPGNKNAA